MTWAAIMQMSNPNEAFLAIEEKVQTENLDLQEMENRIQEYLKLHKIELEEMTHYPNGTNIVQARNQNL